MGFFKPNIERLMKRKKVLALVKILKNSARYDGYIRSGAARALGNFKESVVVEALIEALKDDNDYVRMPAARALGQIGDQEAVAALLPLFRDTSWWVRATAAEALDQLGWQPGLDETGARYWMWKKQWDTCSQIGLPAVAPLLEVIREDKDSEIRNAAVEALGKVSDPQAVDVLLQAIKGSYWRYWSGNPWVGKAVAQALGRIRNPQTLALLADLLKADYREVWQAAMEALEKIDDPLRIPLLIEALRTQHSLIDWARAPRDSLRIEDYWAFEKKAIQVLISMGRASPPGEVFIKAFKDPISSIRRATAEVLVGIGRPSVNVLLEVLQDSDEFIRQEAVKALGQIGDPETVAALRPALQDSAWRVSLEAVKALESIGHPSVNVLLEALQGSDKFVRAAAAKALGQIGDREAVAALLPALQDSDWSVREVVAGALDQLDWKPSHDEVGARY